MNPALLLLGISIAAVGIGVGVYVARRSPFLLPNDRLWVLGDSLGVGLLPQMTSQGAAQGFTVVGNPKGGTIIRQWAQKDLSEIQAWGATAVCVVLGTNDAASSESYVQNEAEMYARQLIHKLQAMGMKVWWLVPGQTGALAHSQEIRTMLMSLPDTESVRVYEPPDDTPYQPWDHIHPTPAGYKGLAAWILGTMQSA